MFCAFGLKIRAQSSNKIKNAPQQKKLMHNTINHEILKSGAEKQPKVTKKLCHALFFCFYLFFIIIIC